MVCRSRYSPTTGSVLPLVGEGNGHEPGWIHFSSAPGVKVNHDQLERSTSILAFV